MTPPLICNLLPRLVGSITRWDEHCRRAREMAFNWLYLNPWHYLEVAREVGHRVFRVCSDAAPAGGDRVPDELVLTRAEVVYLLPSDG